jgi:hypothetical protein
MRVVQRRLHPYEVVPGTTDKVRASLSHTDM